MGKNNQASRALIFWFGKCKEQARAWTIQGLWAFQLHAAMTIVTM
jgi:hypothetical protein